MSLHMNSAIARFRSLPKYLQVRANFKLFYNLLPLSWIIFILELGSTFCCFCWLPPIWISPLYQGKHCIGAKTKHHVSQQDRPTHCDCFAPQPQFLCLTPSSAFSQFQTLFQICKDFHESKSAPDRNLTHELLNCWWKELLGNKNWWKELLENKNCAFTDSVSDRLFPPWNARGEKWKRKERILYWIACKIYSLDLATLSELFPNT